MFDFGFWELTIIMVVALLVVGPERLPALAGQVGKWIGKAKRIVASVRSDIESEIEAAEIKNMLEKQQGEIGELKGILEDTRKELEQEQEDDRELIRAVEKHIESSRQQQSSTDTGAQGNEDTADSKTP